VLLTRIILVVVRAHPDTLAMHYSYEPYHKPTPYPTPPTARTYRPRAPSALTAHPYSPPARASPSKCCRRPALPPSQLSTVEPKTSPRCHRTAAGSRSAVVENDSCASRHQRAQGAPRDSRSLSRASLRPPSHCASFSLCEPLKVLPPSRPPAVPTQ